jgi:hypothetical protein
MRNLNNIFTDVNGEMMCHYKNATYQRGIKFDDGCEKRCTCGESGEVFCNPRCPPPPNNNASDDKCVTVRDPQDNCCILVLCDVTLADQDINKSNGKSLTLILITNFNGNIRKFNEIVIKQAFI